MKVCIFMKRTLILTVMVAFLAIFCAEAKKSKEDNKLKYEIEGAGTATDGNYLVKITLDTKDKNVEDDVLKRAAVHGVLFRGFSNTEKRQSQKPLAGSPANEAQHIDFYKEFFDDGGTASAYASIIGNSRSVMKSGKRYKVSAIVTVSKESLRKYLEEMGVIRGLNSAF